NRHGQYATPRERATSKVSYERVMAGLASTLPADAIITVDAGNFSGYLQRYHSYPAPECLLGPTVGAMGYGLPAAIAAKLAFPERVVVGTSGDGGFLMTGQELATACQYGVPIIHLVFNNFSLGTIRMHQERSYRGRVLGTELVNPDFAAYARAFGALGFTVRSSDEFLPALREALAETRSGQGRPAVLDIHTDLEHISMDHTLDDLRRNR
ncbi:MAG: thiamine pyrophosphate-dependent enzyme, partial [Deltaproteobacteria bacterium]|nr:thiamine pyrophosphate-dependent enzyme [Deltaproteobacteria bacterium]